MWRPPGADHYEPITWDAALDRISRQLQATTPERAVFYTSGRTSNEAAFAYQLFVRLFGTNNLPDCSNMCHESSGVALAETIGVGKGTVSLDDIHEAELLLIIGQNPGTNHPRMLIALEEAKRRGARVVAINPLPEAGLLRFKNPQRAAGLVGRGTAIADLFLPIRVGADLALFQLVNHLLVGRDAPSAPVLDHAFLTEHCDGLAELTEHLGELDADDLLAATGLERDDVDRLVDLVAGSDRIIACWAMGLTQHKGAVATIREIVNTLLLRGSIGRPGAGACPVRGHSNVQGDRTMGIYEQPSDDFLDRLGAAVAFDPPRDPGYDTVGAIEAMAEGRVDVFLAMGGNFVAAAPDTDVTRAALARCGLTVQISTKLNRSHLCTGEEALLLPCLGRTERDTTGGREQLVSVEDSMSVVHASRGKNEPASPHLRSEVAIVCDLADRTVGSEAVDWVALAADYDRIRDLIEQVVPGFEGVNERVRVPGGFTLPNGPRDDRSFATATGQGSADGQPLPARRGATGAAAAADHPLPRPVQHDDLRPRRPLPGHPPRPSRPPGGDRRPGRARVQGRRGGRHRQRVARRRGAAGSWLPPGRLPDAAGDLRGLLPGGQRAGAARQHRRRQPNADVKGGRGAPRATPGLSSELELEPHRLAILRRFAPPPGGELVEDAEPATGRRERILLG